MAKTCLFWGADRMRPLMFVTQIVDTFPIQNSSSAELTGNRFRDLFVP